MSDVETVGVEDVGTLTNKRRTVTTTKVVLKNCGNPKLIATLPADKNKLVLGYIMGVATGVTVSKSKDELEIFTGLKGTFEAVPLDEKEDISQSGKCFLPDAFMQPIFEALGYDVDTGEYRTPEEGSAPFATSVKFAGEVSVVKSSNPQGYSWQLESMMPAAANDPLNELRLAIAQNNGQKQLAAPEAKGKAKGK